MTEPFLFMLSLAALLGLDLLVTAARAGYPNTNVARLLAQRVQADPRANHALSLIQSLRRLQASLRFTQTALRFLLVGLVLSYVSYQVEFLTVWGYIGVLLLAGAVVFWLEWLVEGFLIKNPDEWALRLAPFARLLMYLTLPFTVFPLRLSGDLKGFPEGANTVTADELKTLVDAGQEEGVLEQGERKMIYSIFDLGDTLAREIMVPRIDVVTLEVNTPLPEAIDAFFKSGKSRVPVYEENTDNIIGLLYAKDLLPVWRNGEQLDSLRSLLRPAYFIPEAKKVNELLAEIQSQRIHMAIVVDEYGGVAGLVTLEDIVEEILGEIQDEYDQAEELPFQELAGGKFIFQGKVDLDDFNEVISGSLPKDEADTLGGFIYSRIGRVPHSGEQVQVNNLLLTVEQVTGRRIRKVRAELVSSIPKAEEDGTYADGRDARKVD